MEERKMKSSTEDSAKELAEEAMEAATGGQMGSFSSQNVWCKNCGFTWIYRLGDLRQCPKCGAEF